MEKESTIAEKEESKEVAHPEKDESREEAGVDYCKTIYSIAKEVKGLGCRDFFFL